MKTGKWKLIGGTIIALFCGTQVFAAAAGGEGGGGGAQIEAAFRLKAYGLIVQVANNVQANGLCSSTTMQKGFDVTSIRIVDQLVDPKTGKPITDNLDAWTLPGDMQLLRSSWSSLLNPAAPRRLKNDKSVEVLILHEVYRTTSSCNDNNFRISERTFTLLEGHGTSTYSEMFAFRYPYWHIDTDTGCIPCYESDFFSFSKNKTNPPRDLYDSHTSASGTDIMLCDQPEAVATPGTRITCISEYGRLYKDVPVDVAGTGGTWFSLLTYPALFAINAPATEMIPGFKDNGSLENQWSLVTPNHPFIVVHDIQNNTWTWGLQ